MRLLTYALFIASVVGLNFSVLAAITDSDFSTLLIVGFMFNFLLFITVKHIPSLIGDIPILNLIVGAILLFFIEFFTFMAPVASMLNEYAYYLNELGEVLMKIGK